MSASAASSNFEVNGAKPEFLEEINSKRQFRFIYNISNHPFYCVVRQPYDKERNPIVSIESKKWKIKDLSTNYSSLSKDTNSGIWGRLETVEFKIVKQNDAESKTYFMVSCQGTYQCSEPATIEVARSKCNMDTDINYNNLTKVSDINKVLGSLFRVTKPLASGAITANERPKNKSSREGNVVQ